ncbi:VP4 [Rotavirus G chicken/03V0567/DEU/2003]|uniref:VP4 n=1 Tax=Rotavirus G chicken/03V0567/DEU/2003 TaxID=994995 RepID=M4H256_9REOV|nr:VP4 [Rotavirus G chicken/03V0567/DEU/2003]AFL91895.1 VP4 [Rotavirus G chicken/03V0567/DEU/2003]
MLSYLRKEYATFGGTSDTSKSDQSEATSRSINEKEIKEREKPVKSGDYFCYRQQQNRTIWNSDAFGFVLGENIEPKEDSGNIIYRSTLQGDLKFIYNEVCDPKLKIKIYMESGGQLSVTIDGIQKQIDTMDVDVIFNDDGTITATQDDVKDINEDQKFIIIKLLDINSHSYTSNAILEMTYIQNVRTTRPLKITTDHLQITKCSQDNGPPPIVLRGLNHEETFDVKFNGIENSRTIISEEMDGYWKITQETVAIKLKFGIEAKGVMGGAFKNWLVDSYFVKKQLDYTYTRDGATVSAKTVTYVSPTGKGGIAQPSRPATDYNGQFTVLQPGDIIEVWYAEDQWQINNAIYAKNFQSDTMASGWIGPVDSSKLIYRMNYIPSLAKITNYSGKVQYKYESGGFAQMDAVGYTGLAVIFRFRCVGDKWYNESWQSWYDRDNSRIAYIGERYTDSTGWIYRPGATYGFGAGYPLQEYTHDITLSYTVLKPSDPEFVTGGDNYQESITSDLYEKVRDLQDQINTIKAELNVSGVTSGIFEALTNIGNLPQMFSNFVEVFSKVKVAILGMRKKNVKPKPIEAIQIVSKVDVQKPLIQSIAKQMPEEIELGIIYNSIRNKRLRERQIHEIDKFAIATEMELPMIQRTETLKPKFKKYLRERGMLPENAHAIEFDAANNKFSVLLKEKADILSYKIDKELAHEVLSEMSTSASRSIFSLNVRKQINLDNNFSSPTYADLVNKILDDGELLDVLGRIDKHRLENYVEEFVTRIEDMLQKIA